jgi:hypothetical protein
MVQSTENKRFKFDFKILSILVLIAAVPVLVGLWWFFASFRQTYLELAGNRLGDTAETAFVAVNSHLENQILAIAGLTEVTALRDAVNNANQDLNKNLEEVRKAIPKMVTLWAKLERDSPEVKTILDSPASQYLRRYAGLNQYCHKIIVTDYLGRLVASTNRGVPYYYALEKWWQETFADGVKGAIYVGNVHYDADARSFYMDIVMPIVDSSKGVTGVIKALMDTRGIEDLLGSIRAGSGTAVFLTLEKGDIISAPGDAQRQLSFPGAQEITAARDRGKRFLISAGNQQIVYGLTQKSFAQIYPYLNWDIMSRAEAEALVGPLTKLRTYCMVLLVGAMLVCVIAAFMLSNVESKPIIEEDPHLEEI